MRNGYRAPSRPNEGGINLFNAAITRIAAAAIAVGLVALMAILPAAAQQSPSATRSFSSASVAPGADVTVTIAVANYGGFGRVTENLPAGFTYKSSGLDDSQVDSSRGEEVRFTLQGDSSFTYVVTASSTAGAHTFSGTLRDSDKNNHPVGGASRVTVAGQQRDASATRSFSSASVAPGADVTVTIAVANYGGFGRVTENLPAGFTYKSSGLDDSQVDSSRGEEVRFTLQGDSSFTYVVTASSTAGAHTFSGTLRDSDKNNHPVGGASRVTVAGQQRDASATRSFSSASVAPGADVTVTIAVANYGGFGRVTENLPAGFTYKSSGLDDSQVDSSRGEEVRFTLQGDSSFTYVVTASSTAGAHTFSGTLRDSDKNNHPVGGASRVTVQAPPGPASRSFSPSQVTPNGKVTVRITAANYGGFGRVTETLPAGFIYKSTSLDASQVDASGGQTVKFTLQGETSFTYTATAPGTARTYTFSGTFRDSDRNDTGVGGASRVTVRAASTGGGFGSGAPPNRAPSFDEGASASRAVAENSPAGTYVGLPVAATDLDRDRVGYSLAGDDAALFRVNLGNGQISVGLGTELDFEAKDSYVVDVEATDASGARDTIRVTIMVTNVDEAGVVTLTPAAPAIGALITASLHEPDGAVTDLLWGWERSLNLSTWAAVPGDGWTYTPSEADAGHYLRATATYSDVLGGNKRAQAVTSEAVPVPPTPTPTAAPTATATAPPPAPTATAVPSVPTATAVPPAPTATATAVPPAPTATAVPSAPTATATAPPPAPTATAVPPAPTATATAVPPSLAPTVIVVTPAPTATVAVVEEGGFSLWVGVLVLLVVLVLAGVAVLYLTSRR